MNRLLFTLTRINSLTRRPLPPRLKRAFHFTPHHARPTDTRYDGLEHRKLDWTVYRTTYNNNDAQWNKFKDLITEYAAFMIHNDSDNPPQSTVDTFEWTFMDDPATFNGASPDFLRQHYRQLEKQLGRYLHHVFIQVDQEVLESVTEDTGKDWREEGLPGYIKLVRAYWTPQKEMLSSKDLPCDPEEFEKYEEIDGCKEYDVGWTMVNADLIGPEIYFEFGGDAWHVLYVRPPESYWGGY